MHRLRLGSLQTFYEERPVDTSVHSPSSRLVPRETLTLLQLRLLQVPQLVHLRGVTSHDTLGKLERTTNSRTPGDRILRGLGANLDDTDARVFGSTIMLAVAEVAEPGLEGRRIEGADLFAVGLNAGFTANRCPLARGVEETNVDFRVRIEVVGLAGLGVGVEDEVDAVALLFHHVAVSKLLANLAFLKVSLYCPIF